MFSVQHCEWRKTKKGCDAEREGGGVDEKFLISRPDSSSGEAMFNVLI